MFVTFSLAVYRKVLDVCHLGPHFSLVKQSLVTTAVLAADVSSLCTGVCVPQVIVQPDGAALERVGELMRSGILRAVVDKVYPLEEAAAAHRYLETGHARGKVVLTVG